MAEGREDEAATLKPAIFSGLEPDWTEWSFVMKAYACSKLEHGEALLQAAEAIGDERDIGLAAIQARNAAAAQEAKRFFFMLVMTVKGPGQAILRSVEASNGVEAWRALVKRYEPATAMRAQSIMQAVLSVSPFPATLAEFEERHGDWLADIRRYEVATGERFNEGVKKTVFLQKAPRAIRTMLHMQSDRSYTELVATVIQYLRAATPYAQGHQQQRQEPQRWGPARDPDAMEVDALTRGAGKGGKGGKDGKGDKGKGKGKDAQKGHKGKDLGKAKGGKGRGGLGKKERGGSPSDGCFICGGNHWARDCWWRGKGKEGGGKGREGPGGVNEVSSGGASPQSPSPAPSTAASSTTPWPSTAGSTVSRGVHALTVWPEDQAERRAWWADQVEEEAWPEEQLACEAMACEATACEAEAETEAEAEGGFIFAMQGPWGRGRNNRPHGRPTGPRRTRVS